MTLTRFEGLTKLTNRTAMFQHNIIAWRLNNNDETCAFSMYSFLNSMSRCGLHECVYAGVHVCAHMSLCVRICVSMHVCVHVCVCVCLYCIQFSLWIAQ